MSKLVKSIREAIALSGLKDGMTVSFHHHLRNGDFVLNMVMDTVAQMGIKDLNVNASSLFDAHAPLLTHIQNGVVTGDDVNVRTGPGTNYNRVTQKDKGDVVVITEEATGSGRRWGKMTDGNWICLDYVRYVEKVVTVTGVTVARMPDKTQYKQNEEKLKLDGCILLVTYNDGSTKALTPERSMVTSFSNATPGKTAVTLTCEGKKVTFQVEIIKPTVTFLNWDGTVIASAQYAWGETVTPPENPVRPSDGVWFYRFAGWDQPVVTCRGDAVYTAVYETDGLIGDADKSGSLDSYDATLILQWVAGWDVEIETKTADVDGDGAVTAADASWILQKIAGWNITFTPKG